MGRLWTVDSMSSGIIASSYNQKFGLADEVLLDAPLAYWVGDDKSSFLPTVAAATASSTHFTVTPLNAFDGTQTGWINNGGSSGWIRAQLTEPTVVNRYGIQRENGIPNRNPKDWTFEGSNDGSTWVVLDTRIGVTWPSSIPYREYECVNTTLYLYYRLNITANNGGSYTQVAELEFNPVRARDRSGNSRHGIWLNKPSFGNESLTKDASESSVDLNGTTQYGLIPDSDWMDFTSGITLMAAFRADSLTGIRQLIDRDDNGTAGHRVFQFRVSSNKLNLILFDSGLGIQSITGATTLVAGVKYLVHGVWDGSQIRLYLNGVSDAAPLTWVGGSLRTGEWPISLGRYGIGGSWFDGKFAHAAIWNYGLSPTRIAKHASYM